MPRNNIDISNRIQNHGNFIVTLAFVSTSLQVNDSDETIKGYPTTLESPFRTYSGAELTRPAIDLLSLLEMSKPYTAVDIDITGSIASLQTTFLLDEDLEDNFDLVLIPKYTKEFKIRAKAMRIDKSLPKIFVD